MNLFKAVKIVGARGTWAILKMRWARIVCRWRGHEWCRHRESKRVYTCLRCRQLGEYRRGFICLIHERNLR